MNLKTSSGLLITSISQKIPLIKSVKESVLKIAPQMKFYGADIDDSNIGKYFVDEFWQMPRIDLLDINELVSFCQNNDVRYIIPTRDGELSYFSTYKEFLKGFDIHVMVSKLSSIEICLDKYNFYTFLQKLGLPVVQTTLTLDENNPSSSYVVKERYGSGSVSMGINLPYGKAMKHAKTLNEPIYQPMIEGTEFSIDMYIDLNGRVKGVICRDRVKVVNGESQVTTVKNMPKLERLCSDGAEKLKLYGHVIFQVILDKEGNFHIIECNPRFGGASTLSVAAGLDSFYWFFLESMGENLADYPFNKSEKELTLVRHPQDYIF